MYLGVLEAIYRPYRLKFLDPRYLINSERFREDTYSHVRSYLKLGKSDDWFAK